MGKVVVENNKITITASPSGFRSLGDAWGKCNVSYKKNNNNNQNSEDSGSDQNSINW
tara:strand:+ start:174 stop:344 length:171 start_codon:yes stop_codon:yes gene_type:complete